MNIGRRFSLVALELLVSYGASASTVYPTGTSPNDAAAVQAAVSSGGTVLLKAVNAAGTPTAFNFGTSSGVLITTGVRILGETSTSGTTTIEGGFFAFHYEPSPLPLFRSEIQGIHFNHQNTAIRISATGGALIKGNWITGFSSAAVSVGRFADPSSIAGLVTIADNDIDSVNPYADGIVVLPASATVQVSGNAVRNLGEFGIVAIPGGPVSLSANVVAPGLGDDVNTFGGGIFVFPEIPTDSALLIDHNSITPIDPLADGIDLFPGCPATIINNRVTLDSPVIGAGIAEVGSISDAYVGQNRIDGAVAFGIGIFDSGDGDAVANALIGNNVSGVQASVTALFLDQNTRDTIVNGSGGATVLDLGTNNQITGVGNVGHAKFGEGIRNALATKRAALEALRGKYQ